MSSTEPSGHWLQPLTSPCFWGTTTSTARTVSGTASSRVTREVVPATASRRQPFPWGLLPQPSSPSAPIETEPGPGQGGFHISGVGPPPPHRPTHLAGTFRAPLPPSPSFLFTQSWGGAAGCLGSLNWGRSGGRRRALRVGPEGVHPLEASWLSGVGGGRGRKTQPEQGRWLAESLAAKLQ